jgi:hypothetical protein
VIEEIEVVVSKIVAVMTALTFGRDNNPATMQRSKQRQANLEALRVISSSSNGC